MGSEMCIRDSFRILLPLEKGIPQAESEKEKYEQNEHPLSIPANGNEKKETILIVEDNADMRTYICSILKNNYQLIIRSIIKLIKNSIQNESVKKKYFSSVSTISSPVGKEERMK